MAFNEGYLVLKKLFVWEFSICMVNSVDRQKQHRKSRKDFLQINAISLQKQLQQQQVILPNVQNMLGNTAAKMTSTRPSST